ncbi:hypothetical protein [Marisediminicola antarctica]|uniref:Lipoprotein LpqB N-terminal domain-containing protein n=1 Tax=Marisediminicola antarctica TaxID=674079 RepID=A0A7L5AL22_9MICO|nr:hypothetical protein [Marisediminicola antarctica]QHO70792.1 hypothetical protein BHD05_15190 [Marisediminicola antarctica]
MDNESGSGAAPHADDPAGPRRDRALWAIVSVIAALVIVALVVVLTRGAPELLDADTPEGVVQRYSAAVIAGDERGATEYLSPDVADDCDPFGSATTENLRVALVSTTQRDDTADVRVSITTIYENGPFGIDEQEFQDDFDLVSIDGTWLIEGAPWPLTICRMLP